MSASIIPNHMLAADTFEALIENTIMRPQDLYDLDGETFLRNRIGCVETFPADGFDPAGASCR